MKEIQLCSECSAADGKYKCARCRCPYCSVECYKRHCESCKSNESKAPSVKQSFNKIDHINWNEEYYRVPLPKELTLPPPSERQLVSDLKEYHTVTNQELSRLHDKDLKNFLVNCPDVARTIHNLYAILKSESTTSRPSGTLFTCPSEENAREIIRCSSKNSEDFRKFIDLVLNILGYSR